MVIIELTRRVIRPLTLAVRLAANMIAGHLILALVRGPVPTTGLRAGLVSLVALIRVIALEMGVALIQSYVFVRLICLYLGEVNLNNL
jgi:F0F1-type ATP synthase membrane subunit a